MGITDSLSSWAAIIGILLPALVALLQRVHFSPQWNAIIFGAAVVVASVVYGWLKFGDDFTWKIWEEVLLAILTWGIATYHTYWKPSGQVDSLRKVPIGLGPSKPADRP